MAADGLMVGLAAVVGLAASVGIEQLMRPTPPLLRPRAAWALHVGVWLLAFAVLALALGRPWFAAAGVSVVLLILVQVSNAKVRALREPFVFQDYEYFTDALRHPRLYIPFMGWGRFLSALAGGAAAIALGLWGEAVSPSRWQIAGQLGGVTASGVLGVALLLLGTRGRLAVTFEPERDLRALGFLAFLWRYAEEERLQPTVASPFDVPATDGKEVALPHLVAVQSESFFDPRPLFGGIRSKVLAEFDRTRDEATLRGSLQVPAWGANTVRSEFAFLTGIDVSMLGVHRFNPYRAIADGWRVASLGSFMKRLGYRTICIHPYPASFYQRDRVYPRLGFDEFLDIRAFAGAERFGPYVADAAVADKVSALVQQSAAPLFVFVITMENHGPLHLERVEPGDVEALYSEPPPQWCDDLTIYLRHLCNADRMILNLRQALEGCGRPASLCWFGDHVPIMPRVYEKLGEPNGTVEYVCWNNRNRTSPRDHSLAVADLAMHWLCKAELIEPCVLPNHE